MTSTTPDWRSIAERHRANINGKIPPEWRLPGALLNGGIKPIDLPRQCGVMSDWELHITEWKATDILAVLRDRRAKAVDVVRAFCKRAAIAHQAVSPHHSERILEDNQADALVPPTDKLRCRVSV